MVVSSPPMDSAFVDEVYKAATRPLWKLKEVYQPMDRGFTTQPLERVCSESAFSNLVSEPATAS